jgi:ribosomal protein L28
LINFKNAVRIKPLKNKKIITSNMAKKCDLCGRSATKGASRSHSKIKTLKRQNINLQSKTIDGMKVKLCTSCLRTIDKPKRVKTPRKPGKAPVKPVSKKRAKAAK